MILTEVIYNIVNNKWSLLGTITVLLFSTSFKLINAYKLEREACNIMKKARNIITNTESRIKMFEDLTISQKKQIVDLTLRLEIYKEYCLSKEDLVNLQTRKNIANLNKLLLDATDSIEELIEEKKKLEFLIKQKDSEYLEVLSKLYEVQHIISIKDRAAKKIPLLKKLFEEEESHEEKYNE